jgi:hypothetical protein
MGRRLLPECVKRLPKRMNDVSYIVESYLRRCIYISAAGATSKNIGFIGEVYKGESSRSVGIGSGHEVESGRVDKQYKVNQYQEGWEVVVNEVVFISNGLKRPGTWCTQIDVLRWV